MRLQNVWYWSIKYIWIFNNYHAKHLKFIIYSWTIYFKITSKTEYSYTYIQPTMWNKARISACIRESKAPAEGGSGGWLTGTDWQNNSLKVISNFSLSTFSSQLVLACSCLPRVSLNPNQRVFKAARLTILLPQSITSKYIVNHHVC